MIRCWLYKQVISQSLAAGQTLPARLENHFRSCPDCRAFYEAEVQLTEQLIARAPQQSKNPSPFLHGKIMSAIDRGGGRIEAEPKLSRPRWSAAFVSFGLALACAVMIRQWQPTQNAP